MKLDRNLAPPRELDVIRGGAMTKTAAIWLTILTMGVWCSATIDAKSPFSPAPLPGTSTVFLGWSQDGKAAFFSIESVGGAAGYVPYVNLTVQDTVTDETLYNETLDQDAEYFFKDDSFDGQVAQFLTKNETLLRGLFSKYSIDAAKKTRVDGIPFTFDGKSYDVAIKTTTTEKEIQEFETPLHSVTALESLKVEIMQGTKRKTVLDKATMDEITYSAEFAGVAISPFENRSIIFLKMASPDGDGGRRFSMNAVGAHLSVGFH